jgi:hypothetical protein
MSVTTPNYVCKFDKFSKGIILYVASRRRWFVSQSNIPNHFTSNISHLTVDLTSELVYYNNLFFLLFLWFCSYTKYKKYGGLLFVDLCSLLK